MRNHKVRYGMAALFAVVLALLAWRMLGAPEEEMSALQPLAVSIETVRLVEKPATLPLSGTVEGLTSSIVSSRFSGQVTQVLVEDGQAVAAGQPLFVLDAVELANALRVARSGVRQTAAKYANDRDEYQRYELLYEKGAYSRQQLESARTKMLASEADYDSAQANLGSAQKQVDEATVVSPVSGVIAHKQLTRGQNVSAGTQLMTVEQLDAVHVVLQVEQREMAYLSIGDAVEITVDAYPDRTFEGAVDVISPVAGKESRMFCVKIRVENPESLLKPGMFVQAQLRLGAPEQVLSVPRQAVLGEKGVQYVFTVEDGRAKKVRVETGALLGDRVEILSGVREGLTVVTDNLDKLKEGNEVETGEAS